jgi:hypothetical protein
MGSRFRLQEVSLTLTPDNDMSAEQNPDGANNALQKKCGGANVDGS